MLKPIFNFVSIEKWTLKPKWDPQEYVFSEEGTLGTRNSIWGAGWIFQAKGTYKSLYHFIKRGS